MKNSKKQVSGKKIGFIYGLCFGTMALLIVFGLAALKFGVATVAHANSVEARLSQQEAGIQKLNQLMGEYLDAVLIHKDGKKYYFEMNVPGTPEDYPDKLGELKEKMQVKKDITVSSWKYQLARELGIPEDTIRGVWMEYSSGYTLVKSGVKVKIIDETCKNL